jgi:lipoprotein signal peptidase
VLAALALALGTADLVTKALLPTPDYAFHTRPAWQLLTAVAIGVTLVVVVVAVGSVGIAAAAGVGVGGSLGNLASVAIWGAAPNPFLVADGSGVLAFNLADVLVVSGAVLVAVAASGFARRHRPMLRAPL